MKSKSKETVPVGRDQTVRQLIIRALERNTLSARDISGELRIREKEVYDHLEHIRRSMNRKKDIGFNIKPAECKKCGFVFKKRDRVKKPGRCPVCKHQSINSPLFSIE